MYAMRHHDYHEIVGLNIKHGAINDILIESQLLLLLCTSIGAYTPKRTDFYASVTDLAGSRESWFRDTSVDPKRCSRVVASAGHSISQCSKVCWPSVHHTSGMSDRPKG